MNLNAVKKNPNKKKKELTKVDLEEYRALPNEILSYINAKQTLL